MLYLSLPVSPCCLLLVGTFGPIATLGPAVGSDLVVTTLSSLLCCYFSLSAAVRFSLAILHCCSLSGKHGCCFRPTSAPARPPLFFSILPVYWLVSVLEQVRAVFYLVVVLLSFLFLFLLNLFNLWCRACVILNLSAHLADPFSFLPYYRKIFCCLEFGYVQTY